MFTKELSVSQEEGNEKINTGASNMILSQGGARECSLQKYAN